MFQSPACLWGPEGQLFSDALAALIVILFVVFLLWGAQPEDSSKPEDSPEQDVDE